MARVFLVVMDSVGTGGAPDADKYFNGDVSDLGSNTVLHIAEHMQKKGCPLSLPQLNALGLGFSYLPFCWNRAPKSTNRKSS